MCHEIRSDSVEAAPSKRPIGYFRIINLAKYDNDEAQENIWQFLRDNWLSNRIFKSYDDIVALCCEAWNKLIDQPWKIMSIGQRKWAMSSN